MHRKLAPALSYTHRIYAHGAYQAGHVQAVCSTLRIIEPLVRWAHFASRTRLRGSSSSVRPTPHSRSSEAGVTAPSHPLPSVSHCRSSFTVAGFTAAQACHETKLTTHTLRIARKSNTAAAPATLSNSLTKRRRLRACPGVCTSGAHLRLGDCGEAGSRAIAALEACVYTAVEVAPARRGPATALEGLTRLDTAPRPGPPCFYVLDTTLNRMGRPISQS